MLELYIKEGCRHCRKLMDQLEQEGREYRLHDVGRESTALKAAREQYGASMVPLLVEKGRVKTIGYQGEG